MGGPAVGRAGRARRSSGWAAGRASPCSAPLLIGVIFGVPRGDRPAARGLDRRTAALLALAAFVDRAPAWRFGRNCSAMACFAIVLLLVAGRAVRTRGRCGSSRSSSSSGPTCTGASSWVRWSWPGVAGGPVHDRDRVGRIGRSSWPSSSAVAACLTPFGRVVWDYAVGLSANRRGRPRGSPSGSRPPSGRCPGLLFFGSALAVVALIARRGRSTPWPTLLWLAVFFVDRRLRRARCRVVAARGASCRSAGLLAVDARPPAERPARVDPPRHPPPEPRHRAGALVVVGVALLPVWRPIDPGDRAPIGRPHARARPG